MIPIEAPLYPPAAAFTPPVATPRTLSVRNYSAAELMAIPAAWAIVVKHLPGVRMMADNPQAKPMLSTMTVADFAGFAGVDASAALAAIDAELAALPASEVAGR
jgi:hypothetical protein